MARTKQTARVSTGSPAPRREIGKLTSASGTAHSTAVHATGKPQRTSARNKKQSAPSTTSNLAQASIVAASTGTRVTIKIPASPIQRDGYNNVRDDLLQICLLFTLVQFCSNCRNGGDMLKCAFCVRVLCGACIELFGTMAEAGILCPHCHMFPGGKRAPPRRIT